MKTLLLTLMVTLLSFTQSPARSTKVYISTGPDAVVYHKTKRCPPIRRCLREGHVRRITKAEAKSMGRRPCKRCYHLSRR